MGFLQVCGPRAGSADLRGHIGRVAGLTQLSSPDLRQPGLELVVMAKREREHSPLCREQAVRGDLGTGGPPLLACILLSRKRPGSFLGHSQDLRHWTGASRGHHATSSPGWGQSCS